MHILTYFCILSLARKGVEPVTSGWIIPVYDVRSQERFAFAEDFLRLVLLEQSEEVGGRFLGYALAPLDKEGYIINEDGQLVPFRIYKKGGAQLHPRNCRGGFHKRLTDGPNERPPNTIYDIRPKKRDSQNNPNVNVRDRTRPLFDREDAAIFVPSFNSEEKSAIDSFIPMELKLLKEYNDEFLSEYSEPSLPAETKQITRDPEFDESLNVPDEQSRNSNHIHENYVGPVQGFNVNDNSDLRYNQIWPAFSSDSSLSIEYPSKVEHREPYSYLPEEDVLRTGSKQFQTGYDVAAYPFRQRRNR